MLNANYNKTAVLLRFFRSLASNWIEGTRSGRSRAFILLTTFESTRNTVVHGAGSCGVAPIPSVVVAVFWSAFELFLGDTCAGFRRRGNHTPPLLGAQHGRLAVVRTGSAQRRASRPGATRSQRPNPDPPYPERRPAASGRWEQGGEGIPVPCHDDRPISVD
jgi:hypothetical protein